VSYESHDPFKWVTASVPAALVAALVYALVTVVAVRPAGRGGYLTAGTASGRPAAAASGSVADGVGARGPGSVV
jgi:NCS1 family nucleobase:cation symporter-1